MTADFTLEDLEVLELTLSSIFQEKGFLRKKDMAFAEIEPGPLAQGSLG